MSSAALIGRTLARRFRVTGFIGEGAMATVYRAVQEEAPKDVALKVMHPHLTSDPTFVGRFRREAKAAAQIQHANTVQIIDCGVDGSVLYIAMELLTGQDLFETLVVERRFSEARAARVLMQVCDALTAAHEKHIVHRDLKPENIMLLKDPSMPGGERVKVLDFGIAKILDRDQPPTSDEEPSSMANSALTSVGMVVGTPAYMSPEQCRGEPIDVRSDVYSCGILLYQLITGRLPFAGDNAMELAVKHVRTPPPPPHTMTPGIHPAMEQVILTALNKWPAQRQQTAKDLRAELERILPELSQKPFDLPGGPGSAPVISLPEVVSQRSPQQHLDAESVSSLRSSPIPRTIRTWAEDDLKVGDPDFDSQKTLPAPVSSPFAKTIPSAEPFVLPAAPPPAAGRRPAPWKQATLPSQQQPSPRPPPPRHPPPPQPPPPMQPQPPTGPSPWAGSRQPQAHRAAITARAPQGGGDDFRSWLLIPLAVLVGVGAGILAFFLLR